jgi:hypothetical protein
MIASSPSLEHLLPELAAVVIVGAMGALLIVCMRLHSSRRDQFIDDPAVRDSASIESSLQLQQRLIDLHSMLELKAVELEQMLARAEHVLRAIESSERDVRSLRVGSNGEGASSGRGGGAGANCGEAQHLQQHMRSQQ